MNRDEFIGKLEMVYVGDRNAFNEIVEDNQKLKNLVVYSKVEIDRLNNLIKELSKDVDMWNKKYNEQFNIITELEKWLRKNINDINTYFENTPFGVEDTYKEVLDKLKELKENK